MSVNETRNVLVLTSTLPRWAGDPEPGFVSYLSRELARSHTVKVLAPYYPGTLRHETLFHGNDSVEVFRFRYFIPGLQSLAYDGGILAKIRHNPLNLILVPFFIAAQLYSVAKLQRQFNFDVIHAHWIIPQGLVACIYRTLWRHSPPVIITSHGGDLYALRGMFLNRVKRWILSRATSVTVVSQAMRPHCIDLGCDEAKISVRPMGVDLEKTFTPGDGTIVRHGLIFVGRLVEKKGVEYLVRAMSRLVETSPELMLVIIGSGPDQPKLLNLTHELHLDNNIEFVGSLSNTELPDRFRAAQIAIMPSVIAESGDQEGLGLVAVEAMGCGCAVVASDLPAVRDAVLDGETGLMAIPGDATSLAEKISTLLANDDLRRRLAANGRDYALQKFDWKVVGKGYAELLSNTPSELQRRE